ncbi:hypothetical protein PR048_012978, partial [Dryococelus australis]
MEKVTEKKVKEQQSKLLTKKNFSEMMLTMTAPVSTATNFFLSLDIRELSCDAVSVKSDHTENVLNFLGKQNVMYVKFA